MNERRICPKCGAAGLRRERSIVRLTLSCSRCGYKSVKVILEKGVKR